MAAPPANFLIAAGLHEPKTEPETPSETPPDKEPEPVFNPGPSTGQTVKAGISAEHAWCNGLEQLQLEGPRAVFDEYVAQARLAAYDSATGAFTIAASNAYSRDWLQSRLAATMGRMLTGICYQSVEVRIVARGEELIPD